MLVQQALVPTEPSVTTPQPLKQNFISIICSQMPEPSSRENWKPRAHTSEHCRDSPSPASLCTHPILGRMYPFPGVGATAIPRWWLHAHRITAGSAGAPTEKTRSPPAVATKNSLDHVPSHVTLNQSPAREEEHATWPDLGHKERTSKGGFKVFY